MKKNLLLYGGVGVAIVAVSAIVISFKKSNPATSQNTRQGQIQEAPIPITDETSGGGELNDLAQELEGVNNNLPPVVECADICLNAKAACLAVSDDCVNLCDNWSEEERQLAKAGRSCADFTNITGLVDEITLEQKKEAAATSDDDCQLACLNYVNKCLSLVPNASEALFQDGLLSCMGECANWDSQKINCLLTAPNCESMTDVCGL